MSERQVPFFCPYCGEESLRPAGPDAGDWECGACLRIFQLRFGAVRPPSAAPRAIQPAATPKAAGAGTAGNRPAAPSRPARGGG